jgi:two-component system CitB family sensor kinase
VTVRITDVDDAVRVLVGDTGPGIPSTEVEKIFLDGYSTKSTRNGIRRGLGLALVSRLVLRAGGSIEVAPGPGARFDVRLPLRTPDLEVAR